LIGNEAFVGQLKNCDKINERLEKKFKQPATTSLLLRSVQSYIKRTVTTTGVTEDEHKRLRHITLFMQIPGQSAGYSTTVSNQLNKHGSSRMRRVFPTNDL
jgi:hypothetical protein